MGVKNIIVFGETGSGKSSVVNLLLGEDLARVSDSAVGCTIKFERYLNGDLAYYDTIGLSEGKEGAIDDETAKKRLGKLIDSLAKDGVSLAIMVMKKSRITTMTLSNYELFATIICKKKIPVILMVTGCEDMINMGKWWEENQQHFAEYKEFKYVDVVCGCAKGINDDNILPAMQEITRKRRQDTKEELECKIRKHIRRSPWKTAAQLWKESVLSVAAKYIATVVAKAALTKTVEICEDYFKNKLG